MEHVLTAERRDEQLQTPVHSRGKRPPYQHLENRVGGGALRGRHTHIPGGRMKGKACKIGWGCSREGEKVTETKT